MVDLARCTDIVNFFPYEEKDNRYFVVTVFHAPSVASHIGSVAVGFDKLWSGVFGILIRRFRLGLNTVDQDLGHK